ncbi:adenosylcobinamide-GDP ribazoletransferase [Betaproteobacteria bacterium]|nr:adenosylcobinamide-GDP ribazoletransferase [Betaproteobacteria bacterium]GHU02964.1 adenosylcobinamide-GDP ribazoletransferase [Betaproteobacteria bacterium]GHU20679.1 adenosylcobinamide-GDP ribazoletransferase [Betaproteobacteria bacterium]
MPILSFLREQLALFCTALGFFTRLPIPARVGWSPQRLDHAARYFPLVGAVVGILGAGSYFVCAQILPVSVAVILSMAVTVRATGAFHEDGWADACDGLGAGWDKAQVLGIMKDSRIGSYGAVGLVLMLAAKAAALIELEAQHLTAPALLVAHPLSRLASTSLIYTLDYVRDDASSKSKPLAQKMSAAELVVATVCGLLPLALLPLPAIAAVIIAAALVTLWCARLFVRRLGGYTGDLLGATQQAAELACYLALLTPWNSI